MHTDVASGPNSGTTAALRQVLHGVITGEGPTTRGRIHDFRCVDAQDTALVRDILLAGGEAAVSRAEADLLFDLDDAALDHADGGAFVELFARAIAHHVLAAAGLPVPPRATALERPVSVWAKPTWTTSGGALPRDTAAWLLRRLQRLRRPGSIGALALAFGLAPRGASVAAVVNLAA